MNYAITKKFVSGFLEGMEYKQITGVEFTVGKRYGEYIITSCRPISDNDTVQMEAYRLNRYGGGTVFVSGTYDYIKKCKINWMSNGYYDFHIWAD